MLAIKYANTCTWSKSKNKSMSQKSVKFHIKNNDYFGTLATVLELLRQNIENNKFKKEYKKILSNLIKDLIYLQKEFIIKK